MQSNASLIAKVVLALNGLLFVPGGIYFIDIGIIDLGIMQLLAAVVNFILISSYPSLHGHRFMVGLSFLLNAVIAFTIGREFRHPEISWLHLSWLTAAAMAFIALLALIVMSLLFRRSHHPTGKVPLD